MRSRPDELAVFPLTSPQREIWFDQMLHGDAPSYNLGACVRIAGRVDPSRFERAINLLVQKHDCLRTQLIEGAGEDGLPAQVFPRALAVEVPFHDFSAADDPEATARDWMQRQIDQPIPLDGDRLFRYELLKIAPDRYFKLVLYHHLIVDGWSVALLGASFAEIYSALEAGQAPNLSAPSYVDFIDNDRAYIE